MNVFERIRIALSRDFSFKEIVQYLADMSVQLRLWLGSHRRIILFGQDGDLLRLEVWRREAELECAHDVDSLRDHPNTITDCVRLARATDVVLAVPINSALSFEERLPPHVTTWHRSLIENNFSVWSPFSADDVYFQHRIEMSSGVPIVYVEYTPRQGLDALIAQAAMLGFVVDGLVFPQSSGQPLFFSRFRQSWKWLLRHGKVLSFLAFGLLVCLNLAAFLERLSRQEDLLRQEIVKKSFELREFDLPGNPIFDRLRQNNIFAGQAQPYLVSDRLIMLQSVLPTQAALASIEVHGRAVTVTVPSAWREPLARSFSALEGIVLDIRLAPDGSLHERVLTPQSLP